MKYLLKICFIILMSISLYACQGEDVVDPINSSDSPDIQEFDLPAFSGTGNLIDYKAYFPFSDEETTINICNTEFKEYRMVFSEMGSTSEYDWYLTSSYPTENDTPIATGVTNLLLHGSQAPSNTFQLTAVAYDDPNEPWSSRPKHGKVLQRVSTCSQPSGGPYQGGSLLPEQESPYPNCYVIVIDGVYSHMNYPWCPI